MCRTRGRLGSGATPTGVRARIPWRWLGSQRHWLNLRRWRVPCARSWSVRQCRCEAGAHGATYPPNARAMGTLMVLCVRSSPRSWAAGGHSGAPGGALARRRRTKHRIACLTPQRQLHHRCFIQRAGQDRPPPRRCATVAERFSLSYGTNVPCYKSQKPAADAPAAGLLRRNGSRPLHPPGARAIAMANAPPPRCKASRHPGTPHGLRASDGAYLGTFGVGAERLTLSLSMGPICGCEWLSKDCEQVAVDRASPDLES